MTQVHIHLRGSSNYGSKDNTYKVLGIVNYVLNVEKTKTEVIYTFTNGRELVRIPIGDYKKFESARKSSLECTTLDELA